MLWLASGLALLAFSALIVVWARTRPSYDAYGWLVWGYQTVHGTLDLGGAPSWKPLPFLFTVPYALFGHAQIFLWMTTAVTISLAGAIFAARIAYRLTLEGPRGQAADTREVVAPARRYGALIAALFAACALLGIEDYAHYILSVQSDPVIVTCVIAAVDCHLCGRRRWAFWLLWLGSLGRPEAWLWLGLYGLWAWVKVPAMRWQVVLAALGQLFFWFGVPTITNGRPLVSAQLAENSPRKLHGNVIFGTLGRFTELEYLPVWLAAVACTAWAAVVRNRLVLALAAGAAGWVVVEVAFSLHGWPGLPRYMFEAAALCAVLCGVFVGWALSEVSSLWGGLPRWAGAPVVMILAVALVPGALSRARTEHKDLKHERGRATDINMLGPFIAQLGGATHIRRCGNPAVEVAWVSSLAWWLHMDVGFITRHTSDAISSTRPHMIFKPSSRGGWVVTPVHLRHHNAAVCSLLHARFEVMPGHPNGVFERLS
ncbi:MAG: hypothetical protein QOG59_2712 [Solirubrobacteraceae bacterium]|jgi:hypothetical protein|nr:hypothetical protein [Solirubrobacteraceae bacterium]